MSLERIGDQFKPDSATSPESLERQPEIIVLNNQEVKLFPIDKLSTRVYIDNCMFVVSEKDGQLSIENHTPEGVSGGWRADEFSELATQAVQELYADWPEAA